MAVDLATTPTPSRTTSATSCRPTSADRHQHQTSHIGERVEFLAGAGMLADSVPLHAAQPLRLVELVECRSQIDTDARPLLDVLACLTSWPSSWPSPAAVDLATAPARCGAVDRLAGLIPWPFS